MAGDVLVLHEGESLPADILVLACSDRDGTCYVDTSSLDGETKWVVGLIIYLYDDDYDDDDYDYDDNQ